MNKKGIVFQTNPLLFVYFFRLISSAERYWREQMGVEPTEDTKCPPSELKSAKPTGTYLPPRDNINIYY